MHFKTILFILFIAAHARLTGQNSRSLSISKDSIPRLKATQGKNKYGSVSCGIQDKSGLLWFGTSGEGLYTFDGHSFKNYTIQDGLHSNTILSILEDKNGIIWIGTNIGLCQYNPTAIQTKQSLFKTIQFSLTKVSNFYPSTGNHPSNSETGVWSLMQDKTGRIWIGTNDDGVYCFNGKNFHHFLYQDSVVNTHKLKLNNVSAIIEDNKGKIWFTTWFEGIVCFDGKAVSNYKPNGDVWFGTIYQDRQGILWIGTRDHGVYRYDGDTFINVFSNIAIFNTCGIESIVEDKNGNLWFGTEYGQIATRDSFGGLWRHSYADSSFSKKNQMTNFTMKDGLNSNSVFWNFEDKSGNIWIGTRNIGLCRYDGTRITKYSE